MRDMTWNGMSVKDLPRYKKIQKVLKDELDDNLVTMGNSEVHSDYWDFFELSFPKSPEASEELKTQISLALSTLTSREQIVLNMRFGLGEYTKTHVLHEIGKVVGLGVENVRQIEARALRNLRYYPRGNFLKEFEGGQ